MTTLELNKSGEGDPPPYFKEIKVGKLIDLTQDDLNELTDEELEVLEKQGVIEPRRTKEEKPRLKNEIRTK